MQLPQKQKNFWQLFFTFYKFRFNFKIFKKKITLIADVFLNLRTPEDFIR